MEEHGEFVIDSNDAVEFKFIRSTADLESRDVFKPDMSHQVFGDQEIIFGYKNLKLKLYYTPGWLRTYVGMQYDALIPTTKMLPADDAMGIITKFLGYEYFSNIDALVASLKGEPSFKPFGRMINQVLNNDGANKEKQTFEIYYVSGVDVNEQFLNYYKRLETFVIWYVDGANYIDTDDNKWQHFIVYEKYVNSDQECAYAIVGFATVYEYYAYPSHIRPRISQVLILPPFQKRGLAVHLLDSIYKYYASDKSVIDITVESPTMEFQQLRDFLNVCQCAKLECFSSDKLKEGFTNEMASELQIRFKIGKARRVYEILLLVRTVNQFDDEQRKQYRLKIKRRLNAEFQKFGKMMSRLNEKDKEEQMVKALLLSKQSRIDALDKMYFDLEGQYNHVIDRFLANPIAF